MIKLLRHFTMLFQPIYLSSWKYNGINGDDNDRTIYKSRLPKKLKKSSPPPILQPDTCGYYALMPLQPLRRKASFAVASEAFFPIY